MAIISSFKNKPVNSKTAVFGELGLLGEVRSIGAEDRRIKEATRLGFTTVLSPKSTHNLKEAARQIET